MVSLFFLLFSGYVCILYWRELGQPLPSQHGALLRALGNGYAAVVLTWSIRGIRGYRARSVVGLGVCNFLYQSLMAIAPHLVGFAVPAMRVVFLVAWLAGWVASLSMLISAFRERSGAI